MPRKKEKAAKDVLFNLIRKFPQLSTVLSYAANKSESRVSEPQPAFVILDDQSYEDEPILPFARKVDPKLPALLRKARELENGDHWESREKIFLKQARLLANYEDDFPYNGDPVRYYPTYDSLTDKELRGYFTWRPQIRAGNALPAPLTFIFLHIYELLNLVGVEKAEDAYQQLLFLRKAYASLGARLTAYLDRWLMDFIVYYGLDASLLANSKEVIYGQNAGVLADIENEEPEKAIAAIKRLAPKWLARSRFYATHPEEMDKAIYEIFKAMAAHYSKNCKRGLAEQFFGSRVARYTHIFSQAIFADPLNRRDYVYEVSGQLKYKCVNGSWYVERWISSGQPNRKLEKIIKTIDQIMREEYGFGHPVKGEITVRWILKLIREKVRELLEKKKAEAENRITIDFSALKKIRADAAIVQERLALPEETEELAEVAIPAVTPASETAQVESGVESGAGLTGQEKRLLKSLLYGADLEWLRKAGLMLSVLCDSINDKLYEEFGDTVLDADGAPIEDYVEKLKEMFPR